MCDSPQSVLESSIKKRSNLRLVGKPARANALAGSGTAGLAHGAVAEIVAAADDAIPRDIDKLHRLGLSRLESHRRAGGNIQALAVSGGAIEFQRGVGLHEM